MSDERGGDTAFVVVVLIAAEGGVLQEGPALTAKPIGVGLGGVALGPASDTSLCVAAVVAEEEDQCVIEFTALLESGHEVTNGFVHECNRGGVDRHNVIEAGFFFVGIGGPSLDGVGPGRKFPARIK